MSVSIDIALDGQKSVFCPGDDVSGEVKLTVLSSIKVVDIRIQLLGYSRTHLPTVKNQPRESHDVIHESLRMFPPRGQRALVDGSLEMLDKGTVLTQRFNFTLKELSQCSYNAGNEHKNGQLIPPTSNLKGAHGEADVIYCVKVVVFRPGHSPKSIQKERPITVVYVPHHELSTHQLMDTCEKLTHFTSRLGESPRSSFSSNSKNPLMTDLHTKPIKEVLPPIDNLLFKFAIFVNEEVHLNQAIKIKVLLMCDKSPLSYRTIYQTEDNSPPTSESNGTGKFFLEKAFIDLFSTAILSAQNSHVTINQEHRLFQNTTPFELDLADMLPLEELPWYDDWRPDVFYPGWFGMDLTECFPTLILGNITPCFETCNVKVGEYTLQTRLVITRQTEGLTTRYDGDMRVMRSVLGDPNV